MSGTKSNPVQLGQQVRCGGYQGEVVTVCQQGARVRCDDGRIRFTLHPAPIGGGI